MPMIMLYNEEYLIIGNETYSEARDSYHLKKKTLNSFLEKNSLVCKLAMHDSRVTS